MGKGLGPHLQGITSPIMLSDNNKRYGLGYELTLEDEFAKRASLKRQNDGGDLKIPHIKETFPQSAEIIHVREVAAIEKELGLSSAQIHYSETPLFN